MPNEKEYCAASVCSAGSARSIAPRGKPVRRERYNSRVPAHRGKARFVEPMMLVRSYMTPTLQHEATKAATSSIAVIGAEANQIPRITPSWIVSE